MEFIVKYIRHIQHGISYLCLIILFASCGGNTIKDFTVLDQDADIYPDYKNITIPVNIAPLNFMVNMDTVTSSISVSLQHGDHEITPKVKGRKVIIQMDEWRELVESAVNDSIHVNIFIKDQSGWKKYPSFYWYISDDQIDSYFSYRLIPPGYERWGKMGIYMQNIENYEQSPIYENSLSEKGCMNCHEFNNRDPEEFMIHFRGKLGGTLIKTKESLRWFDTRTDYTMSAGVYPSWHPSGKLIAMSVNKIVQFFHNQPGKSIEVADVASDLILLDIDNNKITTCPQISTKGKETMPCWDPKGEYLYFIKSQGWHENSELTETRYDLYRIKYDMANNTWGEVELVLDISRFNKSISLPKFSPCGRYILFTMSGYGNFTIHHQDANLYIYDTQKKIHFPLSKANSNTVDSYHTWSSSGKWILFSSKRLDGVCSRPYIAHIDENGRASKAFVVPQKDPEYYINTPESFNRPEMMTGPVTVPYYKIRKLIYSEPELVTMDETVELDALSGATKFNTESIEDAEPYMNVEE